MSRIMSPCLTKFSQITLQNFDLGWGIHQRLWEHFMSGTEYRTWFQERNATPMIIRG